MVNFLVIFNVLNIPYTDERWPGNFELNILHLKILFIIGTGFKIKTNINIKIWYNKYLL